MKDLVKKLKETHNLTDTEFKELIETDRYDKKLKIEADKVRKENYGNKVYIRGLIEYSNYCMRNCLYCGIRRANKKADRYRLTKEEILLCCDEGYTLGFRTFVLQGGEDGHFTDDVMCDVVSSIKEKYPDCAVTLSMGERTKESYKRLKDAGADRYLLRHETADINHFSKLHPEEASLDNRMKCLFNLKELGFQVGSGFMVGSPYQTTETLIKDLRFLQKLQPDMIGIGPFLSHCDTPFADRANGNLELTLRMLSILRLMFPKALLPATTALGTLTAGGRELGLLHGANVIMPNLSPDSVRKKYLLYDNKLATGLESAEAIQKLKDQIASIGYEIVTDVGHAKTLQTGENI